MERRAGSGPLGFSERSSTVKEYETLTREKVDVVPFGCGMPETHLMQDWSDRMLDLILNGPTINGIKKDEVRAMLRDNVPEPPTDDWQPTTCPVCGAECWQTDTARRILALEPDVRTACTACALKGLGK